MIQPQKLTIDKALGKQGHLSPFTVYVSRRFLGCQGGKPASGQRVRACVQDKYSVIALRSLPAVAKYAVKTKAGMERSAMTERPKIQTHF